jgi:hypothetical protein
MKRVIFAVICILWVTVVATAQPPINPNSVVLCEHVDYIGKCNTFTLKPDMRYLLTPTLGKMNDKTSSILVGANVTAHVFEHSNYAGFSTAFDSNQSKLSANDIISSLIVARRGQMLEGAYLTGFGFGVQYQRFFPLPEYQELLLASYKSFGEHNDKSEWLRICGSKVIVDLFEDVDFEGKELSFPGKGAKPNPCTKYRLESYQFDEVASSMAVYMQPPLLKIVTPTPTVGKAILVLESVTSIQLEPDTNRPGLDYHDFDLAQDKPELCRDACAQDANCKAFTYIKPGIQGSSARCWLKDSVPRAEHAPCCVSGVKK